LLEISLNFEFIYLKVVIRDNIVLLVAQEKINLYYIYFIRLSKKFIFEINNDVNKLHNTSILLKQKKNILCIFVLRYIKQYLARNETNINFNFLALI